MELDIKIEELRNFIETGAVSKSKTQESVMFGHHYEEYKFEGDSYESAKLVLKDGEPYEVDIKY